MLDTLILGKPLGIAQNYRVEQQLRTFGSILVTILRLLEPKGCMGYTMQHVVIASMG